MIKLVSKIFIEVPELINEAQEGADESFKA
jgi:hypothetical protein